MKVGICVRILLLALVLASCNDMQAYVPGLEPVETLAGITAAVATETPTATPSPAEAAPATSTAAAKPGWQVCTGVERGTVNVRACAGMGCGVVMVLEEGRAVRLSGVDDVQPGSGRWLMITSPREGWINANYVCPE